MIWYDMNRKKMFLHLFMAYFHVGIIVFVCSFVYVLINREPLYYCFAYAIGVYGLCFYALQAYFPHLLTQGLLLYYILLSLLSAYLWIREQSPQRCFFLYLVNIFIQIPSGSLLLDFSFLLNTQCEFLFRFAND